MTEYFIFELGCSNSEKNIKTRSKQQAYAHVVKSTWNKALSRSRKQGYGGKPYWNTRHDITGSDFYYLPQYYAVPYLKVPIVS